MFSYKFRGISYQYLYYFFLIAYYSENALNLVLIKVYDVSFRKAAGLYCPFSPNGPQESVTQEHGYSTITPHSPG